MFTVHHAREKIIIMHIKWTRAIKPETACEDIKGDMRGGECNVDVMDASDS